jgi:hypothetical protein
MTQPVIRDHPTTRSDRNVRNHWGSTKTQRTMSMTMDAWDVLGALADDGSMNRSEVLEILIRSANDQALDLREERSGLLLEKTVLGKVDK